MDTPNLAVKDVKPFIGAKDFDNSCDFYLALGWRVTYDSDDIRVLELEDYRFYLQRYYNKTWCHNSMLHISVSDVDQWFAYVQSVFSSNKFSGETRLSEGIKDEGYARVFHVWDPSGVLLHFAQMKSELSSDK